jgi:rhamnogalacturonyl hydrolase YesR
MSHKYNCGIFMVKFLSLIFFCVFQLTTLKAGSDEIQESVELNLQFNGESYSTTPWSVRMVESEMSRRSTYSNSWGYVEGTFLKSVEELWRTTNDNKYFQYIKNSLDVGFKSDGGLKSYNYSDYSVDEICEGRILLLMYKEGLNETKYQKAIDTLRSQLREQPRTYDGGFWHRNNSSGAYPHQMWLDGVYMANPFYAEYGLLFNEPEDFDDVITQITVMEKHARDSVTGLLYHGWDESKTQDWADPITGCSPSFWGRAVGWYSMAVVDILDYLPQDYSGRDTAILIIQRLTEALKKVQDPASGVWWQVLDQGDREGNYLESSCSCMFVYALAKSIRKGYIDSSYWEVVKKGYAGILDEFISINSDSTIDLNQTCRTAGLGGNPYRSGEYEYYVYQTDIVSNDGKATGPFVLASLEVEQAGLVVPPLSFSVGLSSENNAILTWKDRSYNADYFVVERKKEDENSFTQIAELSKGIESFTDTTITTSGKYYYRAKAVSDTSSSDYTKIDSVTVTITSVEEDEGSNLDYRLYQNYPNPFNPETTIKFSVPRSSHVKLELYDILGKEIKVLLDERKQAGTYEVNFDGSSYPSGNYMVALSAGNFRNVLKITLLK